MYFSIYDSIQSRCAWLVYYNSPSFSLVLISSLGLHLESRADSALLLFSLASTENPKSDQQVSPDSSAAVPPPGEEVPPLPAPKSPELAKKVDGAPEGAPPEENGPAQVQENVHQENEPETKNLEPPGRHIHTSTTPTLQHRYRSSWSDLDPWPWLWPQGHWLVTSRSCLS